MQWDLTGDAAVIGPPPRASIDLGTGTLALPLSSEELEVPYYLNAHYWWAYIHPTAVQLFQRQWLINLILWGNYARLRDAVMAEMGDPLPGRTLQVACAYGDLTTRLSARVADGGLMDIVDVLPIQLSNLCKKLPRNAPVRLLAMDSSNLNFPDASYDRALVFFLLHEQPSQYRERTLSELCRVVKPGGKIIVVDYDLPRWWHPLRYIWRPLLAKLEPFALDLWRDEIAKWLPCGSIRVRKQPFFGGLYQKVVITRRAQPTVAQIANAALIQVKSN
jgi:ubiquinone/menaquinone biosynthesis C-methylase UbiE